MVFLRLAQPTILLYYPLLAPSVCASSSPVLIHSKDVSQDRAGGRRPEGADRTA
ncbi:hypothetical protein Pth03_82990 [Planotetraspora thailandica]|uniref:Uncharacterized protein n=1 Tax=Planotetraspora thailandica TaxID=487172 RepID=A0A8J4DGF6_9ACTN|nr:hypothetical protein Pth03_82990 [Planotetraspora thailandica]